jgi:hypothetical protein
MPESGRWSHIYHLDGRAKPNESLPYSDVFYSLNVLLGLSRVAHLQGVHSYDIERIFKECAALVRRLPSKKYAYGMVLWAGAELGIEIPQNTDNAILHLLNERAGWMDFTAQDVGMLLIGCVEQSQRGREVFSSIADSLFHHLDTHYSCSSGLFYEGAKGFRRRFSSFATQTYLTLACYIYGEWSKKRRARDLANKCSAKLISLQGPQGEWPWFYHTPSGRVVDYYEVYSVHQHGMAPAFLAHSEKHGVAGAANAMLRGFNWIYGQNQRGQSMLWKREHLICRSIIRKGELNSKAKRVGRAIINSATGGGQRLVKRADTALRLECRSYELGWTLWSFGRRNDLRSILYHEDLG